MVPVIHEVPSARPYYGLGAQNENTRLLPELLAFVESINDSEVAVDPAVHMLGGSALAEIADVAIHSNNFIAARHALVQSDEFFETGFTSGFERLAKREIAYNGLRHALMNGDVEGKVPSTLQMITGLAMEIPRGRTFYDDDPKDMGDRNELLALSLGLWAQGQGAVNQGRQFIAWPSYIRQDAPGYLRLDRHRGGSKPYDIKLRQYMPNGSEYAYGRRRLDIKSGRPMPLDQKSYNVVQISMHQVARLTKPADTYELLGTLHAQPSTLPEKRSHDLYQLINTFFSIADIKVSYPSSSGRK